MAKRRMTKKRKRALATFVVVAVLIIAALAAGVVMKGLGIIDSVTDIFSMFSQSGEGLGGNTPVVEGSLNVHLIDVGQADSILLMTSGANMLIDTGDLDDDYTDKIIDYLKKQGVSRLDYLVLTHPDADHIGGAPEIINEFEVVRCIMPDHAKTTDIYENTISALEDNNVEVIEGKSGESFEFGDTLCNVLAPIDIDGSESANNASVVIKLTHGENTFLFTGDAEEESEEKMLEKYSASDLEADFLKAGHHGSETSSTEAFLDAVRPKYAFISCGEGNKYGHPDSVTLDKFAEREIEYYRSDINGTLIVISDGTTLTLTPEKIG